MAPTTAQAFSNQLASAIKGHVEQIMSQNALAGTPTESTRLSVTEVKEQIMGKPTVLFPAESS